MSGFRLAAAACAALFAFAPLRADAWGTKADGAVVRAAVGGLPDSVPAFVRASADDIVTFDGQIVQLSGAGDSLAHDLGPAGFIALGDNGNVMGALPFSPLPANREDYDSALRKAGFDEYKAGYLPYAIIDGFQVVRDDFAYWRAIDVMARTAKAPADRTYFSNLRSVREEMTVRDIGAWSHFVAAASSPLSTSIHSDGWDKYSGSQGIRARFETRFVNAAINDQIVAARMKAYAECGCTLDVETVTYIAASNTFLERVYQLNSIGAFDAATAAGTRFVADLLGAAGTELRNLIVRAWIESEDQSIGTPPVKVRDVESGSVVPERETLGGA